MNQSVALVKAGHANALKAGTLLNLPVATRILNAYCKSDTIVYANQLFDEFAAEADVICWNSVISGCVRNRRDDYAFKYFKHMQQQQLYSEHFGPDSFTLSSVLSSTYCLQRNVSMGEQLHGFALKNGSVSSLSVQNALITLYANWDRLPESKLIIDSMVMRNTVSWTAMISGLAQRPGHEEECLKLFIAMMRNKDEDIKPNQFTFSTIFSSCARLASSQGLQFLSVVLKMGLLYDIHVQNSLLGYYAECGWLEEAKTTFKSMTNPDIVSWNSLLKGYSQYGRAKEALQVFEEMQKFETPDSIAFLSTLSACRHAGLVTHGIKLFRKMKVHHGIEPQAEHISCMVDLLGRAGKLSEAEEFIRGLNIEVSASVWKTYLGACRAHGQLGELVELATEKLLEMVPYDSEARTMLFHIYALSGQWNEVTKLRRLFKEKGFDKEPGFSWIELGNRVHCFAASDSGHPMIKDTRRTLMQLTDHMKKPRIHVIV